MLLNFVALNFLVSNICWIQVPIEGRCSATKRRAASNKPYALLANQSVVNFGGVEIGRQKEDVLILQNDSTTQLMCLVIRVVSASRSFYILNDDQIS